MIDVYSWPHEISLVVFGGPILLAFGSIAFSLYLSRRHLDAMLEALKGSRHIAVWAPGLLHQGWFGRFMLTAKVSGIVTWPGPLIRAGEVDPEEIRNFPAHLKRLLTAKNVLNGIIVAWSVVAFALLKLK
ncbi:hypothetical protein HP532_19795 [Pseudomonas sp. CrR25]|nr:hypothetical protein [Pseudomonas sp. CrR25]